MTQEEKQQLLKDLCARLPYGVKVQHQHQDYLDEIQTIEHITRKYGEIETESVLGFVDDFKPYLRPMSSMTVEEAGELFKILNINEDNGDWIKVNDEGIIRLFTDNGKDFYEIANAMDYLNSIHIDYRGLIEKGLALEAPKGMYELKEEQL